MIIPFPWHRVIEEAGEVVSDIVACIPRSTPSVADLNAKRVRFPTLLCVFSLLVMETVFIWPRTKISVHARTL